MVADGLRQAMMANDGAGSLQGDGVRTGRAEHPVCGDVVEVTVRVDGGTLRDIGWLASGCPASMAVAACAPPALRGQPVAGLADCLHRRIRQLGGLAAHEQHAERLFLRALDAALAGT